MLNVSQLQITSDPSSSFWDHFQSSNRWEMACSITPNIQVSFFCVWYGSSSTNASNSSSSTFLAIVYANSLEHRYHHVWNDRIQSCQNVSPICSIPVNFTDSLMPSSRRLLRMKEDFLSNNSHLQEVNTSCKCLLFDTKSDISTTKSIGHKKSIMSWNSLFTIFLKLVHDVLVMFQSTITYYWSHELKNSSNLVAHLILYSQASMFGT